jgi:1-acyl-sn-glycerol-3-phosphate acyltransferase
MTQPAHSYQGNKLKLYVGSAAFFICLVLSSLFFPALILLCAVLPFSVRNNISLLWVRFVLWAVSFFCGLHYIVEGAEHLKGHHAAIALCKHQSAWETIAFRWILPRQSALLKRSLLWLPVWGWALATLKPIAIDRRNKRAALRKLIELGTTYLNQGMWIVIFPEGTRTAPGEVKKFNAGGALLAEKSGFPVIPIAHNAGEFWPRYSFLKYPGTITVKIGAAIESKDRKATDINAEAEAWIAQAMREI